MLYVRCYLLPNPFFASFHLQFNKKKEESPQLLYHKALLPENSLCLLTFFLDFTVYKSFRRW